MELTRVVHLVKSLKEGISRLEEVSKEEPSNPLLKALEKAQKECAMARNFFDQVLDQDLVDFAIYEMEAAERRYMHLLKLAKKEGLLHTEIKLN
ncbi:DUF2508 family protein [Bacillota bacterium LX-D]|nr:DUF2508 family protein [Bacillota bacterium LX-D]